MAHASPGPDPGQESLPLGRAARHSPPPERSPTFVEYLFFATAELTKLLSAAFWPAAAAVGFVLAGPEIAAALSGKETDLSISIEYGLPISLSVNVFLGILLRRSVVARRKLRDE